MASERLRQREVHKYYQAWLESSVGFEQKPVTASTRYHSDGSQLSGSKDYALTSFAQLGCLKLNVKRGVINLISTTRQYILAEATKTMSVFSGSNAENSIDDLWFGNASIPRSQGISGTALTPPNYTAVSDDADPFTAPALVINDITQHPEFSTRGFAGNGVRFYCGIPLLGTEGTPIGVYSISDDNVRDGLLPHELRFLCDLALIIVRHLEAVKNEAARFRGELMVLGLGQFVRGQSSISLDELSHRRAVPLNPPTSAKPDGTDNDQRTFKGMTITAADPSALRQISASEQEGKQEVVTVRQNEEDAERHTPSADEAAKLSKKPPPVAPSLEHKSSTITKVRETAESTFTRAAKILRECYAADGVLFFDAVSTNLAKRSSPTAFRFANSAPDAESAEHSNEQRSSEHSSDSPVNHESDEVDSADEPLKVCDMLGFAVDTTSQSQTRTHALEALSITERTLHRLIRRYPRGKIFLLTSDGQTSSSEGETSTSGTASDQAINVVKTSTGQPTLTVGKSRSNSELAKELKKLAPQAQSVLWLPLWDFSKQRWSAGAFIWTRRAEQLIVAQDDLVYLKTFANSIMIELARQDAALADETKTSFIANISHELRSPLHGIIGSCELLKDTPLDEHQFSLLKAIELCGQTLNDTVDHVLDYTKINQMSKKGGLLDRPETSRTEQQKVKISEKSALEDDFDLAVLIQDAVESVYASQSSQHQHFRKRTSVYGVDRNSSRDAPEHKNVRIVFKLAHQNNWWVRSQPGAIKRIITNLVQNALKYTDKGTVTVGLHSKTGSPRQGRSLLEKYSSDHEQNVVLTIADTGKGMTTDFVRNHAFTPFSQESSFSDGTGLGLSIVQLIVDSLGGKIELKSKLGIGTEIKVYLSLAQSESVQDSQSSAPRSLALDMSGRSMCLLRFKETDLTTAQSRRPIFEAALANMASAWFNLNVTKSTTLTEDSANFYMYTSIPEIEDIVQLIDSRRQKWRDSGIIVLAWDATEKLELSKSLDDAKLRGITLEIALHPLGPQKLGEVLSKCLLAIDRKRLYGRKDGANTPKSENTATASHQEKEISTSSSSNANLSPDSSPVSLRQELPSENLSVTRRTETMPDVELGKRQSLPVGTSHTTSSGPFNDSVSLDPTRLAGPVTRIPLSSKRVLIVDDNAINVSILKAMMKKSKLPFDTAADGLEALEAFKRASLAGSHVEQPFTHVLMDINMPVMNGIESTRLIRKFEKESNPNRMSPISRRRSAWSDYGPSSSVAAARSLAYLEDFQTQNLDLATSTIYAERLERQDGDDASSDVTGSLTMSPDGQSQSQPQVDVSHPSTQGMPRTRPFLSQIQSRNTDTSMTSAKPSFHPTRSITYSVSPEMSASGIREVAMQTQMLGQLDTSNNNAARRRATIIALSGVAFEQTQKDMFDAGADKFCAKPIKMKDLAKMLIEDEG